jgi:hypothetical protein
MPSKRGPDASDAKLSHVHGRTGREHPGLLVTAGTSCMRYLRSMDWSHHCFTVPTLVDAPPPGYCTLVQPITRVVPAMRSVAPTHQRDAPFLAESRQGRPHEGESWNRRAHEAPADPHGEAPRYHTAEASFPRLLSAGARPRPVTAGERSGRLGLEPHRVDLLGEPEDTHLVTVPQHRVRRWVEHHATILPPNRHDGDPEPLADLGLAQ